MKIDVSTWFRCCQAKFNQSSPSVSKSILINKHEIEVDFFTSRNYHLTRLDEKRGNVSIQKLEMNLKMIILEEAYNAGNQVKTHIQT